MKHVPAALGALALIACASEAPVSRVVPASPRAPTASPLSAMQAYEAKDYAACADQFAQLATAGRPSQRARRLYRAAACHALAGHADPAFAALDAVVATGFARPSKLAKDPELESLRGDPRWPRLEASAAKDHAAREQALTKPALRKELLERVERDQAARDAWLAHPHRERPEAWQLVEPIDKDNTARLRAILEAEGWPTISMVGVDGANAAWLLTQHADLDLALQKDALARMQPLIARDEVSEIDYAYLEDRVAVAEHRKQRYGTQFGMTQEPQPIEDEAHVDERRAAIGLGTLADYRRQMAETYGPAKK